MKGNVALKYLLLFVFLILPGALLGGNLAGLACYLRDHRSAERTHRHSPNPRYSTVLMEYEVAGGMVGSLPGLLILLGMKTADQKKQDLQKHEFRRR